MRHAEVGPVYQKRVGEMLGPVGEPTFNHGLTPLRAILCCRLFFHNNLHLLYLLQSYRHTNG
jgi:hypothetical protein